MNKQQRLRAAVRSMFGGRCAYCGEALVGNKWHMDHVEAVVRVGKWVLRERGYVYVQTGKMNFPERDTEENLYPACIPCNINKHACSLETWRSYLERTLETLANYTAFKQARRFGQLTEHPTKVVFYFETYIHRRPITEVK